MRKTTAVLAMAFASATGMALAGITQIWRQDTAEEFEKGTPTNITITSDGQLLLAPHLEAIYEGAEAYFWAVTEDSKGRVFVGGGNDGKVYVYANGQGSLFFDAPEMEVHALAVDAQDNVYVGTSPDGKIYRVTPDGSSSVFYEPLVKYIWALVVDKRGNLFAGTGDSGKIFQVDPRGNGKVFFTSQEKHIRSLGLDLQGNLLAGSESQARIYRFSAEGRPSILYDAPVKEITSIASARDGTIYAAGIGKKEEKPAPTPPLPPGIPSPPVITAGPTVEGIQSAMQEARRVGGAPGREKSEPPGSEIYRIAPDGYPRQIWRSDRTTVFSLALSPDGFLLAGTGDKGLIYRIESDGIRSSALARAEPSQVTALLPSRLRPVVYAVTSNLTKLYQLKADYASEGTFESQVKDTLTFARWGRIQWRAQAGATAGIKMLTRSGNTDRPDNTWSDWSEVTVAGKGQTVTSPPARFIQWKLVLSASGSKESPVIDSVQLAYLQRNVAPRIESVTLQPPNIAFVAMPSLDTGQPVMMSAGGGAPGGRTPASPTPSRARDRQGVAQMPPRQMIREGYRTISWNVRDLNDDDLLVSLYIRGEGETEWKLLKDKIEENFYSWDTRTLPDGNYTIRVVTSDERSNPPDMVEKSERLTERFDIDNTAPAITGLTAQAETGGRARVRFTVSDSATAISEASYIVNGGDPHTMLSTDGILDSYTETFDVLVTGLSGGENTIVVRVKDGAGNQASAKAVINIK